ncbi:MAG: c-type cytochrome [Bacteroidota bacterium]|nr:c-type cytochrome [Bacteroidota bacterium]
MKKVLGTMAAVIMLAACGGNKENKTEETASAPAATASNDLSANPDYTKGLALVAGSDCLTCHKTSEKNIGPAYKDVAAKYENTEENVKMLAEKVIKGGSGVWGAVPMTPHPQLSQADAEAMVKYVLLLKK